MKKVKKIPNCCSYNSPGFTYSQPFQTDAQMVLDLKLSYEHPSKGAPFWRMEDHFRGRRTVKTILSSSQAAEMLPRCSCTMAWAAERPMPVPPVSRLRDSSAR